MRSKMPTNSVNPLAKHFRQPVIYLRLPSQGRWWPEGSLDLPINGEIPIYAMTAKDEITIRTPDALLNGQGIIDIIQSCCPSIQDAWQMPNIDIDSVLLAIRIASYGNMLELEVVCPECQTKADYEININDIMSNLESPDYSQILEVDNLAVKLKPQNYHQFNKLNQLLFSEQQVMRKLADTSISDEEKSEIIRHNLKKVFEMSIEACTNATESITTSEGQTVTDPNFIKEFYQSTQAQNTRAVQEKLKEFNQKSAVKPFDAKCDTCSAEYQVPIDFDYSRFFA
jgi:T4 bacteriophage base plate protein